MLVKLKRLTTAQIWYSSKLIKTAKNLMFVRGNLLLLLRNNYSSTIYYVPVQCTISGDTLWDMTRGVSFAMKVRNKEFFLQLVYLD